MKKTFTIFTDNFAFCDFINGLVKQKKKFNVTVWHNSTHTEKGFVVWYYK